MLIPPIDLMHGKIVQLQQGEKTMLEFTDFEPWLKRFEKYKLVQVIDLDAAKGAGENAAPIAALCKRLKCQVGGGIRTIADAERVLASGARRVIFGSALFTQDTVNLEFAEEAAKKMGAEKLVFAVDSRAGKVVTHGWRKSINLTPEDAIRLLEPYCDAFLYTHVDNEGLMSGFPMNIARDLREVTKKHLIVAGGIRNMDEVSQLDAMDIDAVVGMAIYTGAVQA